MKNITLTNDQLYSLKYLISEIDYEESSDECNSDLVIEDLYKIADILRPIMAQF